MREAGATSEYVGPQDGVPDWLFGSLAAALQFVRKISGYRVPSKRNEEAFEQAAAEITDASHRLLHAVTHH